MKRLLRASTDPAAKTIKRESFRQQGRKRSKRNRVERFRLERHRRRRFRSVATRGERRLYVDYMNIKRKLDDFVFRNLRLDMGTFRLERAGDRNWTELTCYESQYLLAPDFFQLSHHGIFGTRFCSPIKSIFSPEIQCSPDQNAFSQNYFDIKKTGALISPEQHSFMALWREGGDCPNVNCGSLMHGERGFVILTKSFVKIGITKTFCHNNKMFRSVNKTFGCCSKIFGCSNKNFICCP